MDFRSITVRAKLAAGFGCLAFMMAVGSALAIKLIDDSDARFLNYATGAGARAVAAADIRAAVYRRASAIGNEVLQDDPARVNDQRAVARQAAADLATALQRLTKGTADDTAEHSQERAAADTIVQLQQQFIAVTDEVTRLAEAGQKDAAVAKLNKEVHSLRKQLGEATDTYAHHAGNSLDQLMANTAAQNTLEREFLGGACALALVLAALAGWIIIRDLTRELGTEPAVLSAVAERVAAGDLSPIDGAADATPGSVLASLARMQASLSQMVGRILNVSEAISQGSAHIAEGNVNLSRRTEGQASSLQQTAATMDELSATVANNAGHASEASHLAETASDIARRGGQAVGEVARTMDVIADSSHRIGDITGLIEGIAFQTNILALNAAVEAARAGEHGRGFAVVASEVRSLSKRSTEAAAQIKALITHSVEQVEAGTTLVTNATRTMDEIVGAISQVADRVGAISAASAQQNAGVQQVGTAVSQMDQATQENAALVEQSAAAAEDLRHQAQQLLSSVSQFKRG